jgi:hypothetical protein
VNEVINVVKRLMNSWCAQRLEHRRRRHFVASPKLNTEQDVLSVFRKDVLVPLDDTTVSVKDLYSRFRMWNKNQYCIASCDVENYMAQFFDTSFAVDPETGANQRSFVGVSWYPQATANP